MEEKKRFGLLTLVLFVAGIIVAFIDAVVSESYGVIPAEPSADFFALVVSGPVWWKIYPIIGITIKGVAIIGFLLGSDKKLSERSAKYFVGFVPVILTFVIINFSGLGDIMAQTFAEILQGNNPLNWLTLEWWWTRFMPGPAVISFLMGHDVPLGIDMAIASIIGVVIIVVMWLLYYEKINFAKIREKIL